MSGTLNMEGWKISKRQNQIEYELGIHNIDKLATYLNTLWEQFFTVIMPRLDRSKWDCILIDISPDIGRFTIYQTLKDKFSDVGIPPECCVVFIHQLSQDYQNVWATHSEKDASNWEGNTMKEYALEFSNALQSYKSAHNITDTLTIMFRDEYSDEPFDEQLV